MIAKHWFLRSLICVVLAGLARAEILTLPPDQRPAWLQRDGIVMAGSWEPLLFRVRRDGSDGYTPTPAQREAYTREHSPEMIAKLKGLGVNFVMMHCYKGAGLESERKSMQDAVQFANLCHDAGLRVGVYNYSGAFIWERFFKEVPTARDWLLLDQERQPIHYGRSSYRYYWNRNHPDAIEFYRRLVRFSVEDIQTDLIHFDNYAVSAGFDAQSVEDFRQYLRDTFPADQLKQAGIAIDSALPPKKEDPPSLLKFAWRDFQCNYLARSYLDMGRYARTLRKDILVECNPGGVGDHIRPPIDHARLLIGGEAFWNEGYASGWKDNKLNSRIRSYKTARLFGNMAFSYIMTPLDAAESMAFNHPDCLGCVCWFEYANIVNYPGQKDPMSPALEPYIRFYHNQRDLLRGARVVTDVAVLRNFPSQMFADPKYHEMTAAVEDDLIAKRMPFQIIYDQHLSNLRRWPALVLAGCVSLSDKQIDNIDTFVRMGGKLCIVGPVATHDEWLQSRAEPGLSGLITDGIVDVCKAEEVVPTLRKRLGSRLSAYVEGPEGLCIELTAQRNRWLVHLVNYRTDQPARDIRVNVRAPVNKIVDTVVLVDPERNVEIDVAFERRGRMIQFAVPAVNVYTIAVISVR